MDIKEKAKNYAEGKATIALEQMIADAYADGYKAGYQDRDNELPAAIKEEVNADFIDLRLPSGTLWAKDFLRDEKGEVLLFTHGEALKYTIPTDEQKDELRKVCLVENFSSVVRITTKDGNEVDYENLSFWLSDVKDDRNAYYAYLDQNYRHIDYVGKRHPVLLVKNKL